MPISLTDEPLISLTEAARHLPKRRKGVRPNVATLFRWTKNGCRGIVLESLQVGGTRCTSIAALQRFFERLTAAADDAPAPMPSKPTSKSHRRAEAALDAAGI